MTQISFGSGDDLNILAESVANEMVKLKKWLNENKLFLNWNKTKFMVFANRKGEEDVSLCIDGVSVWT